MKRLLCLSILVFGLSLNSAFAQTVIQGASGGTTGNYFDMMNDIKDYCEESLEEGTTINNNSTDGSLTNIIGSTQKKYSLLITQEDVLQFQAKRDQKKVNTNRLKIVSGLHNEPAHLILPKGYKPTGKAKGKWDSLLASVGIGGDEKPQGISLDLLKDQNIGSWGGGMVSAKALSYFMELNMNVVEIPEGNRSDPGMPVLLVGGQPYKPVEDILATGKYILVPIDFSQLEKSASFYMKDELNYKVDGKMQSVETFAVRALLVGKSFRKESRNQNMSLLAQCISTNLADLADDPDTNPNWGIVYEIEEENDGAQTNWSYFKIK